MTDDKLVEAIRIAMINASIAENVSFQSLMIQFSRVLDIPWDEKAFRAQTGIMATAALAAVRQHMMDDGK